MDYFPLVPDKWYTIEPRLDENIFKWVTVVEYGMVIDVRHLEFEKESNDA